MRSELVRIVAWGFGVALVLAVSCVTIPAALFSIFAQEEVARVPSPSGLLEAVLIESNGGATTSFGYRVIVTRPGWHWRTGTEVVSLYGAIRSESAYGANLVWQNDDALSVEYLSARREKVVRPTASIAGHEVATTLRPGIDDPGAPPGGMLYNLQGRAHDR
jgi:hypothetical protein